MKTISKANPGYITSAFAVAVLLAIFVPVAGAQNYDPPGRVARIRYLQGSVSFRPAGENDWVTAVTNRPMTTGDQIWADAGSRAEVQLGSATIRLNENTGFSFLNLDDKTVQIQLTDGTLNLRVRRIHPNEVFEVDTPNEAFTVTRAGQYRVDAGSAGNSSMVTVRQGQGEVTGGGRTYYVASGQTGTFNGTDSLDGYVAPAPDPDDFDNWGLTRDRQYEGSQSARYVSPDMVGYEDLDSNGSWRSDPRYGNVWYPTSVQSGWAPYREGHWVWMAPWGWTWVDDAPWGYAPFHYGRWISNQGNWGWVPGPVNSEPVYAPALVAFVGGSGFGVSLSVSGGGGNVGWFPLGPREVYVPSYNVSPAYVNRVNVSNTTVSTTTITNVYNNQVTNISNNRTNITYVNQSVPGAVTAVPQAAFRSAQPVARAAVHVDPKQIALAPVVARAPVVPTQNSVLGATASSANRVTRPPQAVASRPVVAKTAPPPPPVPFVRQQQELAKHPGQPLAPREVQTLRPSSSAAAQPQVKLAPPGKQATLNPSRPPNQPVAGNAKQATPSQPPAQQPNQPGNAPVASTPAPPNRSDRPPSAQQQAVQEQADKAKQQRAAQQGAQQQAAEKAHTQPANRPGNAPVASAPAPPARSDRPASAQQQATQQQAAEKARADQAAQQQATERAKQQQAAQQQAAQQQAAEKARADQAAQQQATERAKQQQAVQQQAAQQQAAEKARTDQAAQQQAAERSKQQQAAQQQAAQQQQAEKLREQQAAQQQAQKAQQQTPPQRTDRPPSTQTAQPPQPHPAQPAATPQNRPLTPAEKAREEEQKKQQQQKPEPPQPQ